MLKTVLNAVPRRVLLWAAAINLLVLGGVVVASLLATPIYRSETMLVPKSAFSSSGADLGGTAQAALIGLGLGGSGASKLSPFEAILKSPAVIDRFVVSSGLREAVKKDYIEDYRDLVGNIVSVDFRKDGTIGIAVEDKSPLVAQKYANAYVDAFEQVARGIVERSTRNQAEAMTSIVDHARTLYERSLDRVRKSPIDESLVRSDPAAVAQALTEIESKILQSQIRLAQLGSALAAGNPEMVGARTAHAQLLAARTRLLQATQGSPAEPKSSAFPLDAVLARQSAAIVSAYTQAREKVLVDSMLASSPYTMAQAPTLPEKRIRPQRRKLVSFSLMVQALVTVALLGVFATLRSRRAPTDRDA